MARAPRPILKTPPQLTDSSPLPFASCSQLHHHALHVHFPPTPHLARMEITHSPNTYDRAPIVVVPNDCAIPDRGCRSYGDGDDRKTCTQTIKHRKKPPLPPMCTPSPPPPTSGTPGTRVLGTGNRDRHHPAPTKHIESYFHPRAFEASSSSSYTTVGEDPTDSEDPENTLNYYAQTPPLTRASSPMLSSFLSPDEFSVPVPGSIYQPHYHARFTDGESVEETASSAGNTALAVAFVPSRIKSKKRKSLGREVGYSRLLTDSSPVEGCLGGF